MIVIKANSSVREFNQDPPDVDDNNSSQAGIIDLNNLTKTVNRCGVELEGFFKRSGRTRRPVGFKEDGSVQWHGDRRFHEYYPSTSVYQRDTISGESGYYRGEVVREPKTITETYRFMNSAYPTRANSSCGMHVHLSFKQPLSYCWLMESQFENYLLKVLKEWGKRNLADDDYNKKMLEYRLNGNAYYCQPMKELEFSYLRENGLSKINSAYHVNHLKVPSTHCHVESVGAYKVGGFAPATHQRWSGEDKYLMTNPDIYKFGSKSGFHKDLMGTVEFRLLPAFDSKTLAVKAFTELVGAVIKYLNSDYIKDKTEHLKSSKQFEIIRRSRNVKRQIVTTI